MAPAPSLALFRIFQETLTNVQRHAGAQLVEVQLVATFEALGLLGMRERAQRLSGTFDIQGVLSDETIVTVSISLKPNE